MLRAKRRLVVGVLVVALVFLWGLRSEAERPYNYWVSGSDCMLPEQSDCVMCMQVVLSNAACVLTGKCCYSIKCGQKAIGYAYCKQSNTECYKIDGTPLTCDGPCQRYGGAPGNCVVAGSYCNSAPCTGAGTPMGGVTLGQSCF